MFRPLTRASVLALAAGLAAPAAAQDDPIPSAQATPEQERTVGLSFFYEMDQAGEPYTGPAINNTPLTLQDAEPTLNVPEGFTATLFARGLENPRQALVLPNGDVLISQQQGGFITLLRDEDGDGTADINSRYAERFQAPYGLAYRETEDGPQILVADVQGIWALPYGEDRIRIVGATVRSVEEASPEQQEPQTNFSAQEMITPEGAFGTGPFGHVNRDIAIGPDGTLYVGIGSNGNIAVEPGVPATIQAFEPDGTPIGTVAHGTRNPSGLEIHPQTGRLLAVVQERDGLGDDLVPDYLIEVEQGGFYGWPYSYIGDNPQPGFADLAPELVSEAIVPDLLFQPHSAAMDLVWPTGDAFPADYSQGVFVALKGSWNREQPTGYKVVFAPFGDDGLPTGTYQNFATGFWVQSNDRAEVWGRPADVAFGDDGTMYIVDDTGGTIWQVTYDGVEETPAEDDLDAEATDTDG